MAGLFWLDGLLDAKQDMFCFLMMKLKIVEMQRPSRVAAAVLLSAALSFHVFAAAAARNIRPIWHVCGLERVDKTVLQQSNRTHKRFDAIWRFKLPNNKQRARRSEKVFQSLCTACALLNDPQGGRCLFCHPLFPGRIRAVYFWSDSVRFHSLSCRVSSFTFFISWTVSGLADDRELLRHEVVLFHARGG